MAAIRAEMSIWAGLLVMLAGAGALVGRRHIYARIERSLRDGMGDLPKLNAAMRVILRGGFMLVAAMWALAGLAVVLLNITGPLGE